MEDLITYLKPVSQLRVFKKGTTVLFQGEIPRKAFLIREGLIKAYVVKASGEETIIGFFSKGDIFPMPWLLEASSNTLFYYEAVEDTRVLAFSKDDYVKITSNNAALLHSALKYLNKQHTAQLMRITALGQSRAIEKISFTFYYLLFRYGVEKRPGIYTISIKLSHLTIANLTGITRESTTTNLKTLKNKGIITYTRSVFTINKQKLENFMGEDAFRELTL